MIVLRWRCARLCSWLQFSSVLRPWDACPFCGDEDVECEGGDA